MDVRICTEWRLYNIITSLFGLYTVWYDTAFRMITTISSLSFSIRVHTDQVMPNSISL